MRTTDQRGWEDVTRDKPCRWCGKPDWCRRSRDGRKEICRRSQHPGAKVKSGGVGGTYYVYSTGLDSPDGDAGGGHGTNGHSNGAVNGNGKDATSIPRASPDTRHAVNRALLDHLPLMDDDRDELIARTGLTAEDIAEFGYRSWGRATKGSVRIILDDLVKRFGIDAVLGTPGFFRSRDGRVEFSCLPGILIPVRDIRGRIVGFQIRVSRKLIADYEARSAAAVAEGGKPTYVPSRYQWVSSKKKGGPGPGSPAHIPEGTKPKDGLICLTEGPLKADAAGRRLGLSIISTQGVSTWKSTVRAAKALGATTVRLMLDMDWMDKPEVAAALAKCAEGAMAAGMAVEVAQWDGAKAKGIDDAAVAGLPIDVLTGPDVGWVLGEAAKTAEGNAGAPVDLDTIRERVMAAITADGLAGLYRDRAILVDVARLTPSDYQSLKAELKKIKGFSGRDFDSATKEFKITREAGNPLAIHKKQVEYQNADGIIQMLGQDEEGRPTVEIIAMFSGSIVEEIVRDDGEEQLKSLRIVGKLAYDGIPVEAEVPANKFDEMAWVIPEFGPHAIIMPGRGIRDHVRCAIQQTDKHLFKRRVVRTCTGWFRGKDGWTYGHGGGGVTAKGNDPSISVDVSDLGAFEFPDPPTGEELKRVIRAKLRLLDFGQADRTSSRAMAAVVSALPIRALFGTAPYGGQFNGLTGSHKSCAAALAQQHFGPKLGPNNLPGNWDSTANSNEYLLFAIANGLTVLDDFVPAGTQQDQERAHKDGDRVFRGQGNGSGRRRLRPDGTLRPTRKPRGVVLSTGEDKFRRRSANARALPVWFVKANEAAGTKGTVDTDVLTRCQRDADAGLYAACTAAFIRWLAPRLEGAQDLLARRAIELRPLASHAGDHPRTPDQIADLTAAWDIFLDFAKSVGAIDAEEQKRFRDAVWNGLMEASDDVRADRAESKDAVDLFIELIISALSSGRYYVADMEGNAPKEWEAACGWKLEPQYVGNGGDSYGKTVDYIWRTRANQTKIGWTDGTILYLEKTSAYGAAQSMARSQGESLSVSAPTLYKQLRDAGRLVTAGHGGSKSRLSTRCTAEGRRQNTVVALRMVDF